MVSGSDGEIVPINIEDIAEVVEVDEDGSTHRTFLKEGSSDPILGKHNHGLIDKVKTEFIQHWNFQAN